MNCSHLTVASTDTVTYDSNNSNNLLSPVVPQSPVSQPASPLSSDYCIDTLFDDDFEGTSNFHTEPNVPSSTPTKSPTNFTGKRCFYFPSFWICNLRGGLCSKVDEISEVIFSNKIDIAILVETWLHVNIPDSSVVIPGYEIYRKDRSDRRSGGGILV